MSSLLISSEYWKRNTTDKNCRYYVDWDKIKEDIDPWTSFQSAEYEKKMYDSPTVFRQLCKPVCKRMCRRYRKIGQEFVIRIRQKLCCKIYVML